ncbi:MAG: DUF5615 family PIN-like protein [Planctomycetia bacterium]|nr:DUF5615 family PIN-like protein [Planctomycetia bacterium]
MNTSLYMDHHVKAAISSGLRQRGVDVLSCAEDGANTWEDIAILERATELERVVFTQDDDFLVIADDWLSKGREFSGVIYGHQRSITIGQAIHDLELIAKVIEPMELRNRIVFLPLR